MQVQGKIKKILAETVKKLAKEYKPLKVILFGSYAYGKPTKDSDIDLLILKNTIKNRVKRFVEVKRIVYSRNYRIPISPLIYNPKELNGRIRMGDDFVKDIVEKGITLYEKAS